MKKQEFIEKYGEEAYKEHLLRCKTNYSEHKEEYFERHKKWCENNKDKLKVLAKRAGKKWRDKNRDYQKEWYSNNKETRRIQLKEYYQNNKEKYYLRLDKLKGTILGTAYRRVHSNNTADKNRGFDISKNVTSEWIIQNIFSGQKCIYCGDSDWTHLGCDRIDNSKPHTADNIVCACRLCNFDRKDDYTVEEFKQYRALHPRACDIPKAPAIQLSETGALKKKGLP